MLSWLSRSSAPPQAHISVQQLWGALSALSRPSLLRPHLLAVADSSSSCATVYPIKVRFHQLIGVALAP